MGRLRRLYNLSWKEWLFFLESFCLQIWIGLLLKVIPFRWIPRIFASHRTPVSSWQSEIIELIGAATRRATVVSPWRNKCLVSSLAGRCMLRRRKIDSRLSLGVAREGGGKLIAHAWLIAGEAEIVPKGGNFQQMYLF